MSQIKQQSYTYTPTDHNPYTNCVISTNSLQDYKNELVPLMFLDEVFA